MVFEELPVPDLLLRLDASVAGPVEADFDDQDPVVEQLEGVPADARQDELFPLVVHVLAVVEILSAVMAAEPQVDAGYQDPVVE
jgi:hypothetical protein